MQQFGILYKIKNILRNIYYFYFVLPYNKWKIRQYKDIHKGKRCFIVCNGPSLIPEDLTILYNHKEITFAMNRIYNIFNLTEWNPTYYACQDILIINSKQKEISRVKAKSKFIPFELRYYNKIRIKGATYFHIIYDSLSDINNYGVSEDCSDHILGRSSVTFTCINLARYMGFNEVYLLGCDNNYRTIIDENGNVVTDESVKDYFCEHYDDDIKEEVTHEIYDNLKSYNDIKKYCDSKDFKVYNATRGGKLEVFPRVKFEELFN